MIPTEPYKALLQTLRPLKQMNYQWRGFLAVCAFVGALLIYNFVRLQGRVDVIDHELRNEIVVLRLKIVELENTCEHVSPSRMLNIDIRDAEQQHQIDTLKKKVNRR